MRELVLSHRFWLVIMLGGAFVWRVFGYWGDIVMSPGLNEAGRSHGGIIDAGEVFSRNGSAGHGKINNNGTPPPMPAVIQEQEIAARKTPVQQTTVAENKIDKVSYPAIPPVPVFINRGMVSPSTVMPAQEEITKNAAVPAVKPFPQPKEDSITMMIDGKVISAEDERQGSKIRFEMSRKGPVFKRVEDNL